MSYPMEWIGSTDTAIKSGVATFRVDGTTLIVNLPTFEDACSLNKSLDLAFEQGKRFMADAMQRDIESAIAESRRLRGVRE